jgi:hypothetical protein
LGSRAKKPHTWHYFWKLIASFSYL